MLGVNDLLRNKEYRSIIIKLVILQLIFALMTFVIVNLFMDNINKKILERDMALVGNIIHDYPELENDIVPYITKEVPEKNKALGQVILKDYGYKIVMGKNYQPLLNNISPNIQIFMTILIISFLIPLILMINNEYKKIYENINQVSSAAEMVVEGDFSIYLDEEGEGDFNILNHQFNQMANRLENSLDILKKEKVFLKNTISDISHQLKTPLSSLIILNDILIEDENIDIETKLEFLNRMKSQLNRMEWLIINLLKVARIEAGAIEFKREYILFREIVDISLKALKTQLKNQEINIDGDLDAKFYGDKNWTSEAIINIIKNATEHGKGKIRIILEDTPLFSSIIIKDNGEGIDEEHIQHIFERFYKVGSEVKPESIGIGLNLAKLIIESQGGAISVKSKKGEGTEFIITFLKNTLDK